MDVAWTIVVAVVLAAWFGASVVHQFAPAWWRRINRFDVLRLLPQWHFFAPRPGRRDHHLVVRDVVGDVPTPWRQVVVEGSSPRVRWIYNPARYRQKALTDLVNMLLTARRLLAGREAAEVGEVLSIPYLAMLSWVMAQPARVERGKRQFAIVATTGHRPRRELRIVYVSSTHAQEDADGG